jgi:hypothetical protein
LGLVKKYILIFVIGLAVFLSTWQDSSLSLIFGEIFKSPVIFITPFFIFSEYFLKKKKFTAFTQLNKIFLWFHILYFTITFILIVLWILSGKDIQVLKENIFLKSIKQILYYTFFWLFFRFFYYLLIKADRIKINVDNIFLFIIVLYIAILIIEFREMPFGFTTFHIKNEYNRIRLLTGESSSTNSVLILLLSGLVLGKRNNLKILIGSSFFLLFFLTSKSKMFFIGIGIAFIIMNLNWFKRNILYATLSSILLIIVLIYFVYPWIFYSLSTDIENFTSITSRSIYFLASLKSLFFHPFGTGGLSFSYFVNECYSVSDWMYKIYPDLNFTEIMSLGIGDAKGISPASTFGNFVVLLGIPGLVLLIFLFKIIYKAARNNAILQLLSIYFIITNCFVESIESKFTYAIFFAIIIFQANKHSLQVLK